MPRAKSSLTPQQVTHLKDQLTEILDVSRSKYEIEVTPKDHELQSKKRTKNNPTRNGNNNKSNPPKNAGNNLFVKPLSKQDIEMQQRALSFQIGQEIKTRGQIQPIETKKQQPLVQNEPIKSPRVCYSYETHQSKERVDETNDFLLVLTSPSQNEPEVQATVENWATKEEPPRPKSVTEIAKSFEEGLNNDNLPKPLTPTRNQIETSVSVEQAKKSFEHHDPNNVSEHIEMKIDATSSTENQATADDLTVVVAQIQTAAEDLNNFGGEDIIAHDPLDQDEILDNNKTTRGSPQRTDSFCKAIQSSLGKLSKSTSSLENVLDDVDNIHTKSLGVFNEVSMSNPDISDNEIMSNNKVVNVQEMSSLHHQRPRSRMIQGSKDEYHHPGSKSGGSMIGLNRSLSPGSSGDKNQTKYSRAYLTLVKSGDVTNKLCKFDPNHFPKGYSYKIIQQSKKMTKDYVNKNVTNTGKVNIKAKEHGHVLDTLKKLEAKHNPPPAEIIDINNHATSSGVGSFIDPATIPSKSNLSWTDQKAKLKHFCKKMSHTKILSKMMALQGAAPGAVQLGTEKLLNKSNQEDLLKNVYQGGQVESKVDFFEKPGQRPISSPGPEWMTNNSLKPNNDSASFFSWSKRLNPEDQNTSSAEKHNQFRKYYGYHPGEITTQPLKPKYFLEQQIQESPASLPLFLENLPPPPPIRTNTLNKGADF